MNEDEKRQEEVETSAQQEEAQPELKGRAKLVAKFKTKNPDADFDDDEVFFGAFEEYDNDRETELEEWHKFDTRLRERINAEPRTGLFLSNIMNGQDLVSSLIDSVGEELVDAINSPEAKAKIDEARVKAEQIEKERQANLDASQAVVDEFLKDKSPEEAELFDDYISATIDKLVTGKFDMPLLQGLWKGYKYDDDIAEAAEDGEIRGRNEQIIAKKESMNGGDGVPSLTSGTKKNMSKPQPDNRTKDIWEIGRNMKV